MLLLSSFLALSAFAAGEKSIDDGSRKYPNPAYISYLTNFKQMGIPAPNGKWWGHRREKRAGQKFMDSRVFNMTLRAIDQFTGTDGKQFYAFDGRGYDQAHPKSHHNRMDPNEYKMNLSNGRLYEDFSWEVDVDILSPETKTRKYTYFGTYFTKDNYHRRLANRPLAMNKPNNGWVLQGCITCRGCDVCYLYSGVSLFPDQLNGAEQVEEAQDKLDDIFDTALLPSKSEIKQQMTLIGRSGAKIRNPLMKVNHVIRRLNNLYKNIGSETKFGENNVGKLRKRYQNAKGTGTVIQGVDTPAELYNHSNLLIKEKFAKMGTQGDHLKERLTKLFNLLCSTHQAYCVEA